MATTTTPAAMISTPLKTTLYASGGVRMAVAMATTGGFMQPPRLLAAVPARVLQAVVVAVPATAAPWSSSARRRGGSAMRLHAAASGAASGDTGAELEFGFYKIVVIRGRATLKYLSEMLPASPSRDVAAKYKDVEKTLVEVVDMARAQDGDKLKIVRAMVRGSYGILELACALHWGLADDFLPRLPAEQDFTTVCLAAKDRRKDVMTPPMESLLSYLGEPKMEKIIPDIPETDLRIVEIVYFATGVAMRAANTYNPPLDLGA